LFGEFNSSFKALQWHSYEVQGLENNNNVTLLGSSPTTKYQIFKYKNHAYGIQFHIEIKDNTVSQWGCVPEYEKALEDSLGEGALEKFDQKAQDNMKTMNFNAEKLYNNFKKIL
jgi:GMP synthase-like glutamine amidotransferase